MLEQRPSRHCPYQGNLKSIAAAEQAVIGHFNDAPHSRELEVERGLILKERLMQALGQFGQCELEESERLVARWWEALEQWAEHRPAPGQAAAR